MSRSRSRIVPAGPPGLAEERLVPFETARHIAYADDRPGPFHCTCSVGLTLLSAAVRSAARCIWCGGLPGDLLDTFLPRAPHGVGIDTSSCRPSFHECPVT